MTVNNTLVSGINKMLGQKMEKVTHAVAGELVALGLIENIHTGGTLTETGDIDLE